MDDMNYKNKDDSIWGKRGIRTKSYAKPKSLFLYVLPVAFRSKTTLRNFSQTIDKV